MRIALLDHGPIREQLALAVETLGTVAQAVHDPASGADVESERHRCCAPGAVANRVVDQVTIAPGDFGKDCHERDDDAGRQRHRPRLGGRDRVEDDEGRKQERRDVGYRRVGRNGQDQGREWPAAAEEDRREGSQPDEQYEWFVMIEWRGRAASP